MAVPDYQTLMLPLLKIAGDKREHEIDEAVEILASQFGLAPDDRRELLPSGRQPKFENRVGWARTYLKKAGLLDSAGRGRFRLTDRGAEVLDSSPSRIDVEYLERFPEFVEFRTSSRKEEPSPSPIEQATQKTPEEMLEESYQSLRRQLAEELLERILLCSPTFFERLVVDLLVAMGYGGSRKDAGQAIGRSGDEGIDGIIKEDKLGLDIVYVQAKRKGEAHVGRPDVQKFAGSLEGHRARKGVFITTSGFSQEARDYTEKIEKKIVLIDGQQLAQLMIEHGIGVTDVAQYSIKRLDLDYFEDQV